MIASGATSIPGRARGSRIWARHFPLHGTDGITALTACHVNYGVSIIQRSPHPIPPREDKKVKRKTKKTIMTKSLPQGSQVRSGVMEFDSGEKSCSWPLRFDFFFFFLLFFRRCCCCCCLRCTCTRMVIHSVFCAINDKCFFESVHQAYA